MTSTSSPLPSTIPPIVNHILTSLSRHKQRYNTLATTPNSNPNAISNSVAQDQHDHSTAVTGKRPPPLFVAFQGPQGSGKTFLTRKLSSVLSSPPHNLQVAVLSIDDLYLPHSGLVAVAKEHAGNKLLKGRGLPGTHDILFGEKLLREVKEINNKSSNDGKGDRERENSRDSKIRFPVFEKSLHGGEGDRLPEGDWLVVRSPVDILLFEGWFVGFYPVPEPFIRRLFLATPGPKSALDTSGTIGNEENPIQEINEKLRSESTLEHILTQKLTSLTDLSDILNIPQAFRVDDILEVNKLLEPYVDLWELFDTFIQVCTNSYGKISIIIHSGYSPLIFCSRYFD